MIQCALKQRQFDRDHGGATGITNRHDTTGAHFHNGIGQKSKTAHNASNVQPSPRIVLE
jgi:hypothetical protein